MENINKKGSGGEERETTDLITLEDGTKIPQPPLPTTGSELVDTARELGGKLTHINGEPVQDPIQKN